MPLRRKQFGFILFPLSLLYGITVAIRNHLFNSRVLKQGEFDLPIISIGNITAGGTGKTPHVEYLVKLLHEKFKVAVLSRGYRRKTKEFIIASSKSSVSEIGDEPKQVKQKYNDLKVAVSRKRVDGVKNLLAKYPDLDTIILDDAYQHRYINPGLSILLVDYTNPVFSDYLLPYGNLRESTRELRRAQIVIVTKTPENIKPIEKKIFSEELSLYPYQYLYFTTFSYNEPQPVFKKSNHDITFDLIKKNHVPILAVTGIANAKPLLAHLRKYSKKIQEFHFPDHHNYTKNDLEKIRARYQKIPGKEKIIITTEKDAVRFREMKNIDDIIMDSMYFIPIEVKFLENGSKQFNKDILNYVEKNKEVNPLHK
jgi:tetraacyldisaccharide 4'-kinase